MEGIMPYDSHTYKHEIAVTVLTSIPPLDKQGNWGLGVMVTVQDC